MMGRKVCIRMMKNRLAFALHDAETGECFDDQYSVEIVNGDMHKGNLPTAVVTFRFTEDFFQGDYGGSVEDIKRALDATRETLTAARDTVNLIPSR